MEGSYLRAMRCTSWMTVGSSVKMTSVLRRRRRKTLVSGFHDPRPIDTHPSALPLLPPHPPHPLTPIPPLAYSSIHVPCCLSDTSSSSYFISSVSYEDDSSATSSSSASSASFFSPPLPNLHHSFLLLFSNSFSATFD